MKAILSPRELLDSLQIIRCIYEANQKILLTVEGKKLTVQYSGKLCYFQDLGGLR